MQSYWLGNFKWTRLESDKNIIKRCLITNKVENRKVPTNNGFQLNLRWEKVDFKLLKEPVVNCASRRRSLRETGKLHSVLNISYADPAVVSNNEWW